VISRWRLFAGLLLASSTTPITAIAAPAQPQRQFDVNEYWVEGNTVLSNEEIEETVYPFLGPDRTIADIDGARDALNALYRTKGYPTVTAEIPVQHVKDGIIILQVVERRVGQLTVSNSHYHDIGAIKKSAPSLAAGTVPNVKLVQRDIINLNQDPDRTVVPALHAGRAPNTIDVDLQVQDELPVHATLEVDNRQSQDTTPLRVDGSLTYGNLWQRGDSATIGFQVAPQRTSDALVESASYLFHIPNSQLSILGSYSNSNSDVSTLGSTNVTGKGQQAGFRLLVPLPGSAGFVQTFSIGADWKDYQQNITLGDESSTAPVTYYPVTATYEAGWNSINAQTDFTVSVTAAALGLGSDRSAFDNKRFDATPDFSYVHLQLSRTQTIPRGFQLFGSLQGQLSGQPLVSNEQFYLGGLDSVRGYQESEALGDSGVSLQTEIRTPSLADLIGSKVNDLRLFAFYDAGTTRINDPLPGQQVVTTLSSTGAGVRIRLFSDLNGELIGSRTLQTGPATHAGDNRVLFRVYLNM
jgi:hemolysin activation/secretion protein